MFRRLGPRGRGRVFALQSNRPSTGRKGYAMNALSPLGMVSELPSSNQMQSDAERTVVIAGTEVQKDYFVEKDGVKFAGMHLLVDLWGAQSVRSGSYRPCPARSGRSGGRDDSARPFPPLLAERRRQRRAGAGGKPHLDPHVAGARLRRDRHLHVRRLRSVRRTAGAEGGVPAGVGQSGRTTARPDRLTSAFDATKRRPGLPRPGRFVVHGGRGDDHR